MKPDAIDIPQAQAQDPTTLSAPVRFSILRRQGAWRDALRRRMLAVADCLAVALANLLTLATTGSPPSWALVLIPVWLVLAKLYGLYDNDHRALRHLTVDELPSLIAWSTTATAMEVLFVGLIEPATVGTGTAIRLGVIVLIAAPLLRAAARSLWRKVVPAERALLVGSGPLETATLRKLELFADIHVRCVGVLDDSDLAPADPAPLDAQLAAHEQAGERPDRIIVASSQVDETLIALMVGLCRRHGLKLSVVPPARGMFGIAVQLHHIADLPMIEYSTWDTARSSMLIKRVLDVALAGVGLVLTAPLQLLIALAIKLDSPGPVLFVQQRAGRNARPFRMYKFRSMTADAERRLGEVIDLEALADPMFKLQADPRVTTVGRVLRRLSLDELPQLFNVLRGDMSVVGPRPEQLSLVERYAPEHRFRLTVRPGLTGPMQVYGRGDLRFDERLAVEREYVENLSLRRDLRLILLTVAAVVRGKGAY